MTDDDFLSAFEQCTLPYEQWTHQAHVRVAYLYACQHDLENAIKTMRTRIRAYNEATDTPEAIDRGYHETITQAFMQLVYAAKTHSEPRKSSIEFCDSHPELMTKHALASFYSRDHLMTMQAKAEFVPPDLSPLPLIVDDITTITSVADDGALSAVRQLFVEYASSLDFDLCFQDFDAELSGLPGSYALPRGRLLLAEKSGHQAAGCIALRPLGPDRCEMKRLWVRPEHRGQGLGSQLVAAIIAEAKRIGYATMLLDTVSTMTTAIALYRSHGFVDTSPYTANPISDAVFMRLSLT